MCMCVLPTYMYEYRMCAWCLGRPEGSVRSPGNGVPGSWKCHVDAGYQTHVLCTMIPCSCPRCHLSSPKDTSNFLNGGS